MKPIHQYFPCQNFPLYGIHQWRCRIHSPSYLMHVMSQQLWLSTWQHLTSCLNHSRLEGIEHQLKSDLKLLFNLTLWCSHLAFVDKFIILLRNVLPGHTAQHACSNCSISDNKSLFLHDLFLSTVLFLSASGAAPFNVSIWILRKVMCYGGPSVLPSAIGIPSLVHHSNSSCSTSPHCDVLSAPNSKKSSR